MAYSIDFRKRAIEYMNEGHTGKELHEAFRISLTTLNRWRKLLDKNGSLKAEYKKTRKRKIDIVELERVLASLAYKQ